MSSQSGAATLDTTSGVARPPRAAKWLLPMGWGLTAIGFLGPWISHPTAALTLSGADLAEFVKFLPGVLDGSLSLVRQSFYLPPLATSLGVALLISSRRLQYAGLLRAGALLLALPLSLQLLSPAWSPSTLVTSEFRAQTLALGASWLLLAGTWLLGHLPLWVAGSFSALISLVALLIPLWQFLLARPAMDSVYLAPPHAGWGLFVCLTGLATTTAASGFLAMSASSRAKASRGY